MDQENSHSIPLVEVTPGRPIVTTLRLKILRSVAEGLQLPSIKVRARRAMVPDVRFDYDEKRGSDIRITCSIPMAIFLVEELRKLDATARARRDNLLVSDIARAVAATFKAIEDGDRAAAAASQKRVEPRAETHP